jgi:hypothetical protein
MYIYCVYPAMSKSLKQLPNCLQISETRVVLIVFHGVLCEVCSYTVTFLTFVLHQSGSRKAVFWSMTVNNKKLSNQCNFDCSNRIKYRIKQFNCVFIELLPLVGKESKVVICHIWYYFLWHFHKNSFVLIIDLC